MPPLEPSLVSQLLRVALAGSQRPYVTVISNSMAPLIRAGDQVRLAPAAPEQLKAGEIVVYEGTAELTTHRYWGNRRGSNQLELLTRGDRPRYFDQPVPTARLVGRVTARRRQKRLLELDRGPGRWLNRQLARLARLEIRLMAEPHVGRAYPATAGGRSPGLLASRGLEELAVRVVRRLCYGTAILLTAAVDLFAPPGADA